MGAELHKRECNGRAEASRVEGRDDPVKFPSNKAGLGGWRGVGMVTSDERNHQRNSATATSELVGAVRAGGSGTEATGMETVSAPTATGLLDPIDAASDLTRLPCCRWQPEISAMGMQYSLCSGLHGRRKLGASFSSGGLSERPRPLRRAPRR